MPLVIKAEAAKEPQPVLPAISTDERAACVALIAAWRAYADLPCIGNSMILAKRRLSRCADELESTLCAPWFVAANLSVLRDIGQ